MVDLSQPQRQSPLAIVFLALRTVRQIGMVQIAIGIGLVLTRAPSLIAVAGIVVVIGMVMFGIAALQWWRYTFAIINGELQVHRGVLARQNLTIPLERVQSVSLEQKLLHRLVSLVELSIDTAGTSEAEFTIDAIERPIAEALQVAAADHRKAPPPTTTDPGAGPPPPPVAERILLRHSPARIIKVALTQTPLAGLVVIAPLIAIADDLGRFIPFELPNVDEPSLGWWVVWAVPAAILAGLVISVILNLIRVILTDWNLTITSTAAGLRRNAGLLSTTSVASSLPRMQRIGVRQGVLERWAGLRTVSLDTVGSANFTIPGCDDAQAAEVRRLALEDATGVQNLDRQVSPMSIFLATRNAIIVSVAVAIALCFVVGWWALLAFVRPPLTWLEARRRQRRRRWGISNDAAADRRELFGWNRQEILLRKINGVRVRQSLFERGRDLATVRLDTASGAITIGMIPLAEAAAVRDLVLAVVETDRRAWM